MRRSWIIWAGLKSSDKCPHKRQRRRLGEGKAEVGVTQPQGEELETGSRKRQEGPFLRDFGEGTALQHPDFGPLAS